MANSLRLVPLPYTANSASWLLALRHLPYALWLDSGHPGSHYGRFDILSAAPQTLLETRGQVTRICHPGSLGADEYSQEDPFSLLAKPPILSCLLLVVLWVIGVMTWGAAWKPCLAWLPPI